MRHSLAQCAVSKPGKLPGRTLEIAKEGSLRFHSEITDLVFGEGESGFALAYLRETLLSKYVDDKTLPASELRRSAIVKWLGVERNNAKTNTRLFETDPFFGIGHGHEILLKASRLIKRVLGVWNPEILLRGGFSGGATTSVKRGPGTLASKFLGKRDVTPRCWALLREAMLGDEVWATYNPELDKPRFVRGNVLFTVPKNALIDRVACKEPDYNIFAQKAIGDHIRGRLRRKAGIDLNDQSRNRALAREGSVSRKLATIDLSSASDSLTTGLVSLLLPREWFAVLDSLRCETTFIDGASHRNEMFSSMGNGFTFELESLIFWALAQTVTRACRVTGQISVYGDDIIVPTGSAGALIRVLSWVGFTTNSKKTFRKGGFRESCGGHYMDGADVTPFYLRRPVKDVSDLILTLNQFRAWLIRTGWDSAESGWESPNRFARFWLRWASLVPRSLWGGYDLASRTQLVSNHKMRAKLVKTLVRLERVEEELQAGLYLTRLMGSSRGFSDTSSLVVRDSPQSSITREGKWVVRRCRDEGFIFGLAKPLLLHEQLGLKTKGTWMIQDRPAKDGV